MSQERSFGILLNTPLEFSSLGAVSRVFPTITGSCWADFLFLSIHCVLSTNTPSRSAILHLQESYLIIMANVSHLVQALTATTASKLVSLLLAFSSPAFLMAKKHNNRALFHILYMLNTMLQYQYTGNYQLVYSLIRSREKIDALKDLDFDSAMVTMQRIKDLKNNIRQANNANLPIKGASPSSSTEELPAPSLSKGKSPETSQVDMAPSLSKRKSPETSQVDVNDPQSLGFVPTASWFDSWASNLPLKVLTMLLDHLGPRVEAYCDQNKLNDERQVVQYVAKETMVGVLPQPHPIQLCLFSYSTPMHVWFSSFMWVILMLCRAAGTFDLQITQIQKMHGYSPRRGLARKCDSSRSSKG